MSFSTFIMATFLSFAPAPSPASAPPLTLEKQARGADEASGLFFGELRAHLEDGYAVSAIQSAGLTIDITLSGSETIVLSAVVDDRGRVVDAQVLMSPASAADPGELAYAEPEGELADAGVGSTIAVAADDDGPALVIQTTQGPVKLPLGSALSGGFLAG